MYWGAPIVHHLKVAQSPSHFPLPVNGEYILLGRNPARRGIFRSLDSSSERIGEIWSTGTGLLSYCQSHGAGKDPPLESSEIIISLGRQIWYPDALFFRNDCNLWIERGIPCQDIHKAFITKMTLFAGELFRLHAYQWYILAVIDFLQTTLELQISDDAFSFCRIHQIPQIHCQFGCDVIRPPELTQQGIRFRSFRCGAYRINWHIY